ncbi:MAG: hypothetical protein RIF41_30460 [Polyangiaceae bacterium]
MSPEEREPEEEVEDENDGPVDQLGIPMSREPTLDDVRGDGEEHRRFAVGCSLLVVALVAAFWVVRVMWLGGD